jgi:ABC-type transporter Mla subunit MlaD
MDTNVNNGNSAGNSVGTQTETAGSSPDEVNAALAQLQATVSGFVQEAQASTEKMENLIAHVNQMSRQLRATDSKTQQSAALIEKLSRWITSNRP